MKSPFWKHNFRHTHFLGFIFVIDIFEFTNLSLFFSIYSAKRVHDIDLVEQDQYAFPACIGWNNYLSLKKGNKKAFIV